MAFGKARRVGTTTTATPRVVQIPGEVVEADAPPDTAADSADEVFKLMDEVRVSLVNIIDAAHIDNIDAERNPATAHMFIINPLSGQGMDNLFSTHPNVENRIAALQALAGAMGLTRYASQNNSTDVSGPSPWRGGIDRGTQNNGRRRGPWG